MRFGATVILTLGLFLLPGIARAQDSTPTEAQVKAAFIFNFTKYVFWPADAFKTTNSPLSIGVINGAAVLAEIESAVRGKVVRNRGIVVVDCHSVEEARRCHVVFIGASDKRRVRDLVEGLAGASVLTVGEDDGFVDSGGMINFFREGTRFRFQINDDAARRAGLRIDSKLLELGKKPPA